MFEISTQKLKTAAAQQMRIAGSVRRDAYRTEYILHSLRKDRQATAVVAGVLDRINDNLYRQSQLLARYAEAASRISSLYEKAERNTSSYQVVLPVGWITYQRIDLKKVIGEVGKIGPIRM